MNRPGLIITGATGFIGRHLIQQLHRRYRIFAISRRPPQAAETGSIHWFQADIADLDALRPVFAQIQALGGAEFVLHFAGYYDFSGEDQPAYQATNVEGTRNLLELSSPLNLKKFIFSSSVAACAFPAPGAAITEQSPADADFPYARTKRQAEALLVEYQDRVPACILRLAAIFSDQGEYEPLDHFLQTWCSNQWQARLLAGRGQSAIPYLHIRDLVALVLKVIEHSDRLEPAEVLQASPDGATSHLELYRAATRHFFGAPRACLLMPKPLAQLGLSVREGWGRLIGRLPFERAWMAQYIDRQLTIDASRTRRRLGWAPTPELSLLARLPVLIENRLPRSVPAQTPAPVRPDFAQQTF
ncbi:MAG TPA: NAD-dependent epimerase/dehydratase family protein [Anaerolineae bacterium]|nr:NAD-dependent epimerase/dehydratase family protein [Anaerolineae bacterium]